MTPKQYIRYTNWLDKKGLAICDGTTENMDVGFGVLYPFFILTGLYVFVKILMNWQKLKERIIRGK